MKILWGWKDFSKAANVHIRTLKEWHYRKKRIPFQKTSGKKQGKIFMNEHSFLDWLNGLFKGHEDGN